MLFNLSYFLFIEYIVINNKKMLLSIDFVDIQCLDPLLLSLEAKEKILNFPSTSNKRKQLFDWMGMNKERLYRPISNPTQRFRLDCRKWVIRFYLDF